MTCETYWEDIGLLWKDVLALMWGRPDYTLKSIEYVNALQYGWVAESPTGVLKTWVISRKHLEDSMFHNRSSALQGFVVTAAGRRRLCEMVMSKPENYRPTFWEHLIDD